MAIGEEADEVVEQRARGGWEEGAAGCQGDGRAHPTLRHFLYHHLKMADLCHTTHNIHSTSKWLISATQYSTHFKMAPYNTQHTLHLKMADLCHTRHNIHIKMAGLCHTQHAQLACGQYSNGECSHLLSGCTKSSHDSCLSKETEIAVCNCALFTAG